MEFSGFARAAGALLAVVVSWHALACGVAQPLSPDSTGAKPAVPQEKTTRDPGFKPLDRVIPAVQPLSPDSTGAKPAVPQEKTTRDSGFKPLDGVAARVNGEVITWTDVRQRLGNVAGVLGHATRAEFEEKLWDYALKNLRELIHDKLLLQMAKQEGITVSTEEVARELQIRKQRAGSSWAFVKQISDKGQTLSDVEREIENDLLRQKYTQAKVNYVPWAPHMQRFFQRAAVWLRCVHLDGSVFGGREKTQALARAVVEALRKGTEPAKVDRSFQLHCRDLTCSVDDLKPVHQESGLLQSVKNWAFSRPVGAVSEPLELAPGNWKVFLVARKQDDVIRKFEEVQGQIEESLRRQGLQNARLIMRQELYKQADIEPLDLKQWIQDGRNVLPPNQPVVRNILSKPL
jgi:SurA-like protein